MKSYKLLRTGRFDSAFRLCELSRQKCIVQPVYITSGRDNEVNEIESHRKIYQMLLRKKVKSKLFPVEYIPYSSIKVLPEIESAFWKLSDKYPIGTQYYILGQYAHDNPGVEVCFEKYCLNVGRPLSALFNYHSILKFNSENIGYIDKNTSEKDVYTLFGSYYFPTINRSEMEMYRLFKAWHYEDIMNSVVYCDRKEKEPCGVCVPCRLKFLNDMAFFLPPKAKKNALIYYILNKCGLFGNKLKLADIFADYIWYPAKTGVIYNNAEEGVKPILQNLYLLFDGLRSSNYKFLEKIYGRNDVTLKGLLDTFSVKL